MALLLWIILFAVMAYLGVKSYEIYMQRRFHLVKKELISDAPKYLPYISIGSFLSMLLHRLLFPLKQQTQNSRRHMQLLRTLEQRKILDLGLVLKFMGPVPVIVVHDSELARTVMMNTKLYKKMDLIEGSAIDRLVGKSLALVNSEEWHIQRKILGPSFQSMERFLDVITRNASRCLEKIFQQKSVHNIEEWTSRFALDVLGETVFGFDFEFLESDKYLKFHDAYCAVMPLTNDMLRNVFPILNKLPTKYNAYIEECYKTLDEFVHESIKQIKNKLSANEIQNSIVAAMIQSKDELTGKTMTDREIHDNILVFYLAGHDTTQAAINFALIALGLYPEIQKKLREEVDSVLKDRIEITPQDLLQMQYLSMFIQEVIRVYGAASFLPFRVTQQDTELGGYFIPKGTPVEYSPYCTHFNPSIWQQPHVFNPERWRKPSSKQIQFGFGYGPRMCIGMNLSLWEQRVFLCLLVKKYHVTLSTDTIQLLKCHEKQYNPLGEPTIDYSRSVLDSVLKCSQEYAIILNQRETQVLQ